MTVTATYNSDLSRVRVAATDAFTAATITIDRSADGGVTWQVVRGGTDLPAGAATVDDYEFAAGLLNTYRARSYSDVGVLLGTQTGTVTPSITKVWLKSIARPFLNQAVTVEEYSEISRKARAGLFEIPGRSFPVRVGEVASSRSWSMDLLTYDDTEAKNLEFLVASGDVVLVQVPAGFDIPGGYVGLGDMKKTRVSRPLLDARRRFSLPMTEVAAPPATVVGYAATWAGILATYGTWSAVLAAFPTWADVLEFVTSPEDVIVP